MVLPLYGDDRERGRRAGTDPGQGQNERIRVLNDQFAAVCTHHAVAYIDTFTQLIAEPVWAAEVNAGDGSHPSTAGYERLTEIIFARWFSWLTLNGAVLCRDPMRAAQHVPGDGVSCETRVIIGN